MYQGRKTLEVCGGLIRLSLVWRITREEVGTVVGCTMGRVSMLCSILNDDQKQTLSTDLLENKDSSAATVFRGNP